MRYLLVVFAIVGFIGLSQTSATAESQLYQVAKLDQHVRPAVPKNATPLPHLAQTRNCSLSCGANSGSANCTASQTCDCSCNRQPICQCR